MSQLFLCLAMLSGVTEAGERELVLNLCIEKAVPRAEWRAQVLAEASRQGKATPEVIEHFATGTWYRREIGYVRHTFIDHFRFQGQVWYLTGDGKEPHGFAVTYLNRRVREMGKDLAPSIRKWPAPEPAGK